MCRPEWVKKCSMLTTPTPVRDHKNALTSRNVWRTRQGDFDLSIGEKSIRFSFLKSSNCEFASEGTWGGFKHHDPPHEEDNACSSQVRHFVGIAS